MDLYYEIIFKDKQECIIIVTFFLDGMIWWLIGILV